MADVAEKRVEANQHEYSEEEYEHAKTVELPVLIAKIDCVDHKDLCQQQGIRAYPTLRLFVNGEAWHGGEYRGHRTVVELADWLRKVEDAYKEEKPDAPRALEDAHGGKSSMANFLSCRKENLSLSSLNFILLALVCHAQLQKLAWVRRKTRKKMNGPRKSDGARVSFITHGRKKSIPAAKFLVTCLWIVCP